MTQESPSQGWGLLLLSSAISWLEAGKGGLWLKSCFSSSAGMNALQLQNLATLAAAAAAAQTSATTTNANPLSTTSSALGALTSPGKGCSSPAEDAVCVHLGARGRGAVARQGLRSARGIRAISFFFFFLKKQSLNACVCYFPRIKGKRVSCGRIHRVSDSDTILLCKKCLYCRFNPH